MSNTHLFEPWPDDRLEPAGNPAYEGVGYPAAGYGQTVRQLVPLPAGYGVNPQLAPWEDPAPVGQRVYPRGSIVELRSAYGSPMASFGLLSESEAKNARLTQGMLAIKAAEDTVAAMKKLVDSPPFLTNAETLGAWRGAYKLNVEVLERYRKTLPYQVDSDIAFSKWLNGGMKPIAEAADAVKMQIPTQGLWNALKFTFIETAKTVTSGVEEIGKRAITAGEFVTRPWMLIGLAVAAGAIFLFAKSGGSFVRVSQSERAARDENLNPAVDF